MAAEENDRQTGQKDPRPLTDKEFDELKKKEKRTGGIISAIIDFSRDFSIDVMTSLSSAARLLNPEARVPSSGGSAAICPGFGFVPERVD